MRLINSYLSEKEMSREEVKLILDVFTKCFNQEIEVQHFKYDDRNYYETDIDIVGIHFHKEKVYAEIDNLIQVNEKILQLINNDVDIIVANDDTDTEIQLYENDWNNIFSFGLFITKRDIPNVIPYYSSSNCNAYLNFEYVSFGAVF